MNIKLNIRLNSIIKHIKYDDSIIDVGSDHGYLPIKLAQINSKRKIIATDIAKLPLSNGKKNANKYNIKNIDFRLSDGLDALNETEKMDILTISGLGDNIIINTLISNKKKIKNIKKFIFIPSKNTNKLRKFLYYDNYKIIKDIKIIDRDKIYYLLICKKDNIKDKNYSKIKLLRDIQFLYGLKKLDESKNNYNEFANKIITSNKKIYKQIKFNEKNLIKKIKLLLIILYGMVVIRY